ncbi:hypothetical protein TNIN_249681 [Trichonephila inaurata madagascariensis]|uniref:Uncharacterized protein n=1 Tax=Trichonephila inaurata madagascariensis TaxID=2747483 RepID=A0A8X6IXS4_9ARAC|nr:hypothetical protein TNIN_249681 [Trichonephila inaurata madagascariensis]
MLHTNSRHPCLVAKVFETGNSQKWNRNWLQDLLNVPLTCQTVCNEHQRVFSIIHNYVPRHDTRSSERMTFTTNLVLTNLLHTWIRLLSPPRQK